MITIIRYSRVDLVDGMQKIVACFNLVPKEQIALTEFKVCPFCHIFVLLQRDPHGIKTSKYPATTRVSLVGIRIRIINCVTEYIVTDGQLGFGIETSSLRSMFMHNILRKKVLVIGFKIASEFFDVFLAKDFGIRHVFPFHNIYLEVRSLHVKDFCLTVP